MKPLEAFEYAIEMITWIDGYRRDKRPGSVIERMSVDAREALSKLTSDELSKYRLDFWETIDRHIYEADNYSQTLMEFDKKMKKPP